MVQAAESLHGYDIARAIEPCLPFLDAESNISKQIPLSAKETCIQIA
jgi:hypothetical protein